MNDEIEKVQGKFSVVKKSILKQLNDLGRTINSLARDSQEKERTSKVGNLFAGLVFPTLSDDPNPTERFRKAINSPSIQLLPVIGPETTASQKTLVTRTYRRLLVQGRHSIVADLVKMTESDLEQYRNIGSLSIRLIKYALDKNNLGLGMTVNSSLINPSYSLPLKDLLKGETDARIKRICDLLNVSIKGFGYKFQIARVADLLLFTEKQIRDLLWYKDSDFDLISRKLEKLGITLPK